MREGCWASVDVGLFPSQFHITGGHQQTFRLASGLLANAGDTEYILVLYTLSPFRKTGWLPNNRSWLVTVLDAGKSKSKAPGWRHSGESRSHGAAAAPAGWKGRGALADSYDRQPRAGPCWTFMITNPVRDPSTLMTEAPSKAPPPDSSCQALEFQHGNWQAGGGGTHTNIQTITPLLQLQQLSVHDGPCFRPTPTN